MLDPQLVDQAAFYPSVCIDGSQPTANEPCVETHIEIVGDYHVYLSKRLVVTSAHLYGMVDAADAKAKDDRIEALMVKVAALEIELAEAQPVLNAMAIAAQRWGDTEAVDEPVRKTGRKAA